MRMQLLRALQRVWIRAVSRGIRYTSNHHKIDLMYMTADPWQMSSPAEEHRFAAINQIISDNFGHLGSLLEIGCGEGHQSVYLERVAERVVGLDVSPRAVARARNRCPEAQFLVGTIFSPEVDAFGTFDLLVASEVLYYMDDIPGVLRRMREVSRSSLVTYFSGEMANLDPHVLSVPGAVSTMVEFGDTQWRVVWWRNN